MPVALVLFVLASIYPARKVDEEFRQQIQSQLEIEATHLRDLAEQQIANCNDACAAVAANDIVVNSVIDPEYRNSTLRPFVQSIRLPGPDVANVVLTDYRGKPIVSKNKLADKSLSPGEGKWLANVMAGKPVTIREQSVLIFAHPVVYGGQPEAAID